MVWGLELSGLQTVQIRAIFCTLALTIICKLDFGYLPYTTGSDTFCPKNVQLFIVTTDIDCMKTFQVFRRTKLQFLYEPYFMQVTG